MKEPTKTEVIPEISRAAERYLEQYGDPLVTNTYLKIAMLCLAALCVMPIIMILTAFDPECYTNVGIMIRDGQTSRP